MKKHFAALAACAVIPAVLAACSPAPKSADRVETTPARVAPVTEADGSEDGIIDRITPHAHEYIRSFVFGNTEKRPRSGVTRKMIPSFDGTYSVEYIHTPHGIDKDDTLDYKLDLSDDNTFTMQVVSDGVVADHVGHWYARRGEIMLYYDEDTDPTAHNIYVASSLYCDILQNGKLMIYDNCRTVVLSRDVTGSAENDRL